MQFLWKLQHFAKIEDTNMARKTKWEPMTFKRPHSRTTMKPHSMSANRMTPDPNRKLSRLKDSISSVTSKPLPEKNTLFFYNLNWKLLEGKMIVWQKLGRCQWQKGAGGECVCVCGWGGSKVRVLWSCESTPITEKWLPLLNENTEERVGDGTLTPSQTHTHTHKHTCTRQPFISRWTLWD